MNSARNMVVHNDFNITLEKYNTTKNSENLELSMLQPVHMIVIYSAAYSIVFVCALLGNCMVVTVVFRNASMHTVTNYFIANLAVADILVAIFCLPITLLTNLYGRWLFGPVMCKVTPYLQGVSVCASVNTLAAIAVDRYFAICQSLKFKIRTRTCKIIIFLIWLSSLAIIIPWAVFYTEGDFKISGTVIKLCLIHWPSNAAKKIYFLGAIFFTCYTVPLILITVCYLLIALRVWRREQPGVRNSSSMVIQKSKMNVLKMLAVVVVLFAFSWMPLYVANFIVTFQRVNLPDYLIPIAQWLGSSNSGMNPFIYCIFSKRFRNGFKDIIICFRFLRRSPNYIYDGSCSHSRNNSHNGRVTEQTINYPIPVMTSDNSNSPKSMLNSGKEERLINGSDL